MTIVPERMSVTLYAEYRKCSEPTVRKRIKEGSVVLGEDKKLDVALADANWNAGSQRIRDVETPPKTIAVQDQSEANKTKNSLLDDKARNERLKAEKEEIKLAQLRGELIDKAQVLSHVESVSRRNADSWLVFAQDVSVELADELGCDPDMLFAHLDNAVRVQLQTVSELEFEIGH